MDRIEGPRAAELRAQLVRVVAGGRGKLETGPTVLARRRADVGRGRGASVQACNQKSGGNRRKRKRTEGNVLK